MRNDLSGDWLRAIRPDDEHALPEATSYDEDAYNCDLAQGELGAIGVDEEAQDWDELEEDGVAPRVAKDVFTPTAQEIEEHNATHSSAVMVPSMRRGQVGEPSAQAHLGMWPRSARSWARLRFLARIHQ